MKFVVAWLVCLTILLVVYGECGPLLPTLLGGQQPISVRLYHDNGMLRSEGQLMREASGDCFRDGRWTWWDARGKQIASCTYGYSAEGWAGKPQRGTVYEEWDGGCSITCFRDGRKNGPYLQWASTAAGAELSEFDAVVRGSHVDGWKEGDWSHGRAGMERRDIKYHADYPVAESEYASSGRLSRVMAWDANHKKSGIWTYYYEWDRHGKRAECDYGTEPAVWTLWWPPVFPSGTQQIAAQGSSSEDTPIADCKAWRFWDPSGNVTSLEAWLQLPHVDDFAFVVKGAIRKDAAK